MKRSRLRGWYRGIQLWVRNTAFRWMGTDYDNEFVEVSMFIGRKIRKKDRSVILALFDAEELHEAGNWVALTKWWEASQDIKGVETEEDYTGHGSEVEGGYLDMSGLPYEISIVEMPPRDLTKEDYDRMFEK